MAAIAQPNPVSQAEATTWVRYTIPLPKSISIPAKVVVPKTDVVIQCKVMMGPVITQACRELTETMGLPGKANPSANAFKILLELGGPEAEKLKSLTNSDQAYAILPQAGNKGLRLVALTSTGLYYAAKTLQQLVKPRVTRNSVEIPLPNVTDWPDMEKRGLWGADTYEVLRWMGDRKLNIEEQISARAVEPDGRGRSMLKPGREPMIKEGPLYCVEAVPAILHLEQLTGSKIFDVYPNLRGTGGQAGNICYSQPQIVNVLTDWISDLASLPTVQGVDVWMAENLHGKGGCRCAECKKTDRSVLEIRVILSAWRKAEERLGKQIQLYVLSSEETVSANPLVLKELPDGVRFWYYQWLTYKTGRRPMVTHDLVAAAKQGKWIGIVPNLDSMTHFLEPFTGADFIHYRMNEFVDKGLKGLLGYATPKTLFNDFNVEAAAEWSWNAKGRTPQEFALSYAVRRGFKNPKQWAEWADLAGPVEWDIYGSEWTCGAQGGYPGPVAKLLLDGKLPKLGALSNKPIPFGQIRTVEQLDGNVVVAAKALKIAREMGMEEYLQESLVAAGYAKSLKALYELGQIVKDGKVAPADRNSAERYFQMYSDGLKQASDALPKWEKAKGAGHGEAGFTAKAVDTIAKLRAEMAETADKLGFSLKP